MKQTAKKSSDRTKKTAALSKPEPLSNQKASGFKSFVCRFVLFAVSCCFTTGIVLIAFCYAGLPDIDAAPAKTRPPKIELLDANGGRLAVYGANYGAPVSLNALPDYVAQAVVATEDARFYTHRGIDWKSVVRAVAVNALKGRKAQGASTITQQVVKNLFLSADKTMARKLREMMLAVALERRLLEMEDESSAPRVCVVDKA